MILIFWFKEFCFQNQLWAKKTKWVKNSWSQTWWRFDCDRNIIHLNKRVASITLNLGFSWVKLQVKLSTGENFPFGYKLENTVLNVKGTFQRFSELVLFSVFSRVRWDDGDQFHLFRHFCVPTAPQIWGLVWELDEFRWTVRDVLLGSD